MEKKDNKLSLSDLEKLDHVWILRPEEVKNEDCSNNNRKKSK